ncbi:hypothetical protein BDK88_1171 [Natrinema hispanicum]|uniref:PIN like domain-containing protein n=1 Tax=Natrinema hispanicum TaxID=392421 RepID=A0A482YAG6_9EURY|nr:hypothetical protein [Natrinema hispanicum]RZV12273.1 hypothetical protein BDK88_1171 [Natrinema hispanicum]
MDKRSLLNAVTLMDGRLIERRNEIKRKLTEHLIAHNYVSGQFEIHDVQKAMERETGLEVKEAAIESALQSLEDDEVVKHVSGDTYRATNPPTKKNFATEFEPVWFEYKDLLENSNYDRQIDYKIDNHKNALEDFFLTFFHTALENSGDLDHSDGNTLLNNDFPSVLSDVVERRSFLEEDIFKEKLEEYVENRSSTLLRFTGTIYTGIVNFDLLSRERYIDFSNAPDANKILFLDTNILIGLLCKTDPIHPLVSSICDRSQELGYDLYFLPPTSEELEYVIEKADKFLNTPSKTGKEADNQFVVDFTNRGNIHRTERYFTEINRWRKTLDENWNITQWNDNTQINETDYTLIKNWVRKVDELESDGEKSAEQIAHDTKLIASATAVRSSISDDLLVGPFVVSNNSSLLSINDFGKKETWENGVVIHPQGWLDYLVAFSPAKFTENEKEDVAEAIISTASTFDQGIDLDGYLDILASRSELEGENKEFLKDIVYETPIISKLESTIEEGDNELLESEGRELMNQVNELLREKVDNDKQLRNVSESYKEEKERRKIEEEKRKELEKVIEDTSGLEITNIQKSNQEMKVQVTQDMRQNIEKFSNDLESALEGSFDKNNVPEPPDDYSNVDSVISWLEKVEKILSTAEKIPDKAKQLQPYAIGLLASLGA